MDLISSLFIGMIVVVVGSIIGIVVIVWQALRSVKIDEQLYLPFTSEDFTSLDDAVIQHWRDR